MPFLVVLLWLVVAARLACAVVLASGWIFGCQGKISPVAYFILQVKKMLTSPFLLELLQVETKNVL